jgi:hypothetical protein
VVADAGRTLSTVLVALMGRGGGISRAIIVE